MKKIIFTISFLLPLLFISCKKKEEPLTIIESDKIPDHCIGLYEWSFSEKTIVYNNKLIIEASNSENKFAIEIFEDSRVVTFKDGKEVDTYYVTTVETDGGSSLVCKNEDKNKKLSLRFINGMIVNYKFPILDAKSYLYKN